MIPDQQKHFLHEWHFYLHLCCLAFLWNFGETHQDRKFLLSKEVFPLAVNDLLLQPPTFEENGQEARRIVAVNEKALGPFGE